MPPPPPPPATTKYSTSNGGGADTSNQLLPLYVSNIPDSLLNRSAPVTLALVAVLPDGTLIY
jgi:hypothetical protein